MLFCWSEDLTKVGPICLHTQWTNVTLREAEFAFSEIATAGNSYLGKWNKGTWCAWINRVISQSPLTCSPLTIFIFTVLTRPLLSSCFYLLNWSSFEKLQRSISLSFSANTRYFSFFWDRIYPLSTLTLNCTPGQDYWALLHQRYYYFSASVQCSL